MYKDAFARCWKSLRYRYELNYVFQGELNAATYPMYARTGKPLVMLFGTEFQRIAPASFLGHLAASNAFSQFHFVWLNRFASSHWPKLNFFRLEGSQWDEGLKLFVCISTSSDTPGVLVATEDGGHIAILDQGINKAFWYDGNTSSEKDIRIWISDFLQGKLSPQGNDTLNYRMFTHILYCV